MEKLIRPFQLLRNNHYIKDAVILLSGNGLKIFLGFISNVILAKFFGAENLSIYGTLMAIQLLSVNVTDFGFGNTLNQLSNRFRDQQQEIFSNIFILKIIFLMAFLGVVFLFNNTIAQYLTSLEGKQDLIQLLIISIAGESLFRLLLSSLQAKHLFKRYSLLMIINNAFRLAGIIVLYIFHLLTLKSIIVLYGISFIIILLTNSRALSFSLQLNLTLIKKISQYTLWVWLFIIFNTLFVKSDILLVNYLKYDKAVIGNYILILFFISLISLLQDAIFTQLLPKTSEFRRQADYQKYYSDIKYIRIGAIILSLVYIIILPFLLKLIYAAQYQIDYMTTVILGVPFLFSMFNEFNGVLLYAMERHRYISMANVLGLVFVVISLIIFSDIKNVLHVVIAMAIGKLVVESFVLLKVKQCLRLVPE